MKAEKFPLTWPDGFPTTEYRVQSKFDCNLATARDGIVAQLKLLGVSKYVLSTNAQRNKKGELTDGRLIYPNPGVALYFIYNDDEKVIACDKWKYLHENLRAVEKSLDAIRGLERWGCSDITNRAIGNMKALPEHAGESNKAWWQVLGVKQNASQEEIKKTYWALAKKYHPDTGENPDTTAFDQLTKAYNEAPKQKNGYTNS